MFLGLCPVRISFAGGGSDLPEYFNKYGGAVISTTINQFTYVVIQPRLDNSFQAFSPDFQKHYKPTKFEKIEIQDGTEIASSVTKYLNFKKGVNIMLFSDVPAGSGLGASSSLTVNLVNSLTKLNNLNWSPRKIAETAFDIERKVLKWAMGIQDEYIASFGGLNYFQFSEKKIKVTPVAINSSSKKELQENLLLFFVGKTRKSSKILNNQLMRVKKNNPQTINALHIVKDLAYEIYSSLKNNDIEKFGELLDKGWNAKKNIAKGVSNTKIDKIYDAAIKYGAKGGKLTGAGGGGHMLLYCPHTKQKTLIQKMQKHGLTHIPFKFFDDGPKILTMNELISSGR